MEVPKSSTQNDDEEEFHDALDDFAFYDCIQTFSELLELNDDASISGPNPNPSPKDKDLPWRGLRRRRSHSHHKPSGSDSSEMSNSPITLNNYLRERKLRLSCRSKECTNELGNSDESEIIYSSEYPKIVPSGEKGEKSEEHSTITNANATDDTREELAWDGSNMRETQDTNPSVLLTLAGILIKSISFQIHLFVKIFMFPLSFVYYIAMLVFNPFVLLKHCREYFYQKTKTIWKIIYDIVSQYLYEWLKEHQSIWRLGLKFCWGLLWSIYVCSVLVGLLLSAFVMSGIIIRVMVEEPIRIQRSLNFDYKEKSPMALVPIITGPESIHHIYLGEKPETWEDSRSRVIPANHKLKVTVSLTLPESVYNQNLGVFQVRVDFLAAKGKILAMSRRPCMFHFKSQPIRLLLTLLKAAPILTGFTTETQNLNVNFIGFTEGETPTACLRVVIEQRAEFSPGAGIPEIYSATLTLESQLPLIRKVLWFWKKTLFVWISTVIFTSELFFALLCCKPILIPRIRFRGAANRDDSRNDRPGRS